MTECDASNVEIGVVLCQEVKLLAYFSKNINEAKKITLVMNSNYMHYLLPEEFIYFTI